jgi:hypothetical protein
MIIAETGNNIAQRSSADTRALQTGERITVALIAKAEEDLQCLRARTGLSKTDIVNRALSLYEFIDGQLHAGSEVLIRNSNTGETRLLRLI